MVKFQGYMNKVNGDNRIFTNEDVEKMSVAEYKKNRDAVLSQMSEIWVPKEKELSGMGEEVYVTSYKRDDGVKVSSYYRAKPNGGSLSNYSKIDLKNTPSYIDNMGSRTESERYRGNDKDKLRESLRLFNAMSNKNDRDARDFMNYSITGGDSTFVPSHFSYIDKDLASTVSGELGVEVPKGWSGLVFKEESSISKNVSNSPELLKKVEEEAKKGFPGGKFVVTFKDDENLFKSIHNATVLNPKIDKDGNFTGVLYDKYDFAPIFNVSNTKSAKTTIVNNGAYALQGARVLKKYYVVVPIRVKLRP